jgi:ribosomal protein S18 acetylase RimI-like enzyme
MVRAVEIMTAGPEDDDLLADHYLAIWDDYGVPRDSHRPEARARVLAFLREGRRHFELGAFLALSGDGVIGSACAEVRRAPYPEVLVPEVRKVGYLWSVWVDPAFRRRGAAAALVRASVAHLRAIGCTSVVLHSSDAALSLYEHAGFRPTNERVLVLRQPGGPD